MLDDVAKTYGPGTWHGIHVEAAASGTPEECRNFIAYLRRQCASFPCLSCSSHCLDYLTSNPPEDYIGRENGMLLWSWTFHNSVNVRLGKPPVPWSTAVNAYTQGDFLVCTRACGS